jgi:hypothetical protein
VSTCWARGTRRITQTFHDHPELVVGRWSHLVWVVVVRARRLLMRLVLPDRGSGGADTSGVGWATFTSHALGSGASVGRP